MGNIMFLNERTSSSVVKIIDFGLSTSFAESPLMKECVGTSQFMAPEVFNNVSRGNLQWKGYTEKVDVWSMGICVYEICVGVVPWKGRKEAVQKKILNDDLEFPPKEGLQRWK